MFWNSSISVIISLLWVSATVVQAAEPTTESVQIREIALPAAVAGAAIDPVTGDLAMTDGKLVTLYPRPGAGESKPIDRFGGTLKSLDIVAKMINGKGYFASLHANLPSVVFTNVGTRMIEHTVELPGPALHLGTTLNADCPYLFYTLRGNPGGIGRINVSTFKDEGLINFTLAPEVRGGGMFDATRVLASPDGTMLYAWTDGQSPSGIRIASVDPAPGAPVGRILAYQHASATFAVDPAGRFVVVGSVACTVDRSLRIARLPGRTVIDAFLPDRPIAISRCDDDAGVDFFSTNSFEKVLHVQFAGVTPERIDNGPSGEKEHGDKEHDDSMHRDKEPDPSSRMFVDSANNALLIIHGKTLRVVDLKKVHLPAEPALVVRVDGDRSAVVGVPTRFKIVRSDPAITLSIVYGPRSMSLEGDTLKWTPTAKDVGTVDVTLKAELAGKDGVAHTIVPLQINVEGPSILLPFAAQLTTASPDGSILVAVGGAENRGLNAMMREPPRNNAVAFSRVAVIDMKKRLIVVDKTFPGSANCVATDGRYIFLATGEKGIRVLSATDLNEKKKFDSEDRVFALTVAGDEVYGIPSSQAPATIFRISDLKNISPHVSRDAFGRPMEFERVDPPKRIENGWLFKGVVWDESLVKARLLIDPEGFQSASERMMSGNGMSEYPWGGPVDQAAQNIGGRQQPPDGSAVVNDRWVTFAATSGTRGDFGDNDHEPLAEFGEHTYCVDAAFDVQRGNKAEKVLVYRSNTAPTAMTGQQIASMVTRGPDYVAAAYGSRIYVAAITDLPEVTGPPTAAALPQMEARQNVFLADLEELTILDCKLKNATAAQFLLLVETPGVSIDQSNGKVTIDPKQITSAAVQIVARSIFADRGENTGIGDLKAATNSLAKYQLKITPLFQKITGKAPTGVPVTIETGVGMQTSDGKSAVFYRSVLMELPTADVTAAIEAIATNGTGKGAGLPHGGGAR